jgi:hypothetical protein
VRIGGDGCDGVLAVTSELMLDDESSDFFPAQAGSSEMSGRRFYNESRNTTRSLPP